MILFKNTDVYAPDSGNGCWGYPLASRSGITNFPDAHAVHLVARIPPAAPGRRTLSLGSRGILVSGQGDACTY